MGGRRAPRPPRRARRVQESETSYPPHLPVSEEPLRLEQQDHEDDCERGRRLQLGRDLERAYMPVLDDEVERDSDQEASDDGSCRAVEAPEDGGGEGVD